MMVGGGGWRSDQSAFCNFEACNLSGILLYCCMGGKKTLLYCCIVRSHFGSRPFLARVFGGSSILYHLGIILNCIIVSSELCHLEYGAEGTVIFIEVPKSHGEVRTMQAWSALPCTRAREVRLRASYRRGDTPRQSMG